MHAELLTIGSELLNGATVNSNAAYLARRLAEAGIACRRQTAVRDDRVELCEALQETIGRTSLVLITGGLGPTFDDITLEMLAEVTGHPLVRSPAVAATIRRFYTRRQRTLQRAALRQAALPEGGVPLPNPIGTAPGVWLELGGRIVVALPGVPAEMRAIMDRSVMPRLRRLVRGTAMAHRTLRTVGIVELSIQEILERLPIPDQIEVGLYPHLRAVDVRLTATARSRREARRLVQRLETALRRRLGSVVYGVDGDTLEAVVGTLLVARHKTLSVAESCTGGLIADRITDVSGSSRYFRGGVIAYHNALKQSRLGVPARILTRHGAVSAQTATRMAEGVRLFAGSDLGLAITGIAGPTGGTKTKPVGLVYLALADGRRTQVARHQFFGDRESIKWQAAQTALDALRCVLLRAGSA